MPVITTDCPPSLHRRGVLTVRSRHPKADVGPVRRSRMWSWPGCSGWTGCRNRPTRWRLSARRSSASVRSLAALTFLICKLHAVLTLCVGAIAVCPATAGPAPPESAKQLATAGLKCIRTLTAVAGEWEWSDEDAASISGKPAARWNIVTAVQAATVCSPHAVVHLETEGDSRGGSSDGTGGSTVLDSGGDPAPPRRSSTPPWRWKCAGMSARAAAAEPAAAVVLRGRRSQHQFDAAGAPLPFDSFCEQVRCRLVSWTPLS